MYADKPYLLITFCRASSAIYLPSRSNKESDFAIKIGSSIARRYCAFPMYPSLYILPKIQFLRTDDRSGERMGLIREGNCADEAIKADSAKESSSIDFAKYLSAAASTPYALFPRKIVFKYKENISSFDAMLSSSKAKYISLILRRIF